MSATKYQKGVATVVDTEIDKWAEEAINGEVSISKRPHKNEEAVASKKVNTSADDIVSEHINVRKKCDTSYYFVFVCIYKLCEFI
jgi:hypothetical protein